MHSKIKTAGKKIAEKIKGAAKTEEKEVKGLLKADKKVDAKVDMLKKKATEQKETLAKAIEKLITPRPFSVEECGSLAAKSKRKIDKLFSKLPGKNEVG